MIRRTGLLAAVLSLCLFTSGCLGPDRLFNDLHEWNGEVSEQDWVNEVVFVVCLPVYGIAYMVDIVVMNTIDYWGGDNS
ncbi:MAG: DUF3332 family protein [Planctomycetota bacterium]|nr:DUF3332 family protein [Planctomycetota bacterium]